MEEASQSIPEDIITQFLLRLPVKTLLRFKSVCKTWYDLIKSDKFISMHHNFDKVSQLLISKIFQQEGYNRVLSFRSNDALVSVLSPDLDISANCDGNVLVAGSFNGIVCFYDCHSTIFLCNPALREFKQLPPSSFHFLVAPSLRIGIGFGFDSSNIYDIKVIRIFYECTDHREIRAEMFTLSSNTWRQLHWGLSNELVLCDRRIGLFCANSFNFIMQDPDHVANVIVYCDIHTERFKTMEFPPKPEAEEGSFHLLMAFKGCLSSMYIYPRSDEKPIEIWVMTYYGVVESWTKLYTVMPPSYSLPLCFWMDDHGLLLHQIKTEKLLSCDLKTLNIDDIKNFEDLVVSNVQVVVYKETLVSICDTIT